MTDLQRQQSNVVAYAWCINLSAQLRRRQRRRIGDLAGVISLLPYLAELGIDAIWLARSTHRRSPTAATTSPTTATSIPALDPCRTSTSSSPTPTPWPENPHRHRSQPHLRPASLVPGSATSTTRVACLVPVHLPNRTRRRPAADGLAVPLRRQRLGTRRRPVVLPPVRPGTTRPQLGQPVRPGVLPADPAVLGRPRRRRIPHRRGPRPVQGPGRTAAEPAAPGSTAPARRHRSALRPGRSARDLPELAGRVQRIRPAADGRRRNVASHQRTYLPLRPPRRTGAGVRLLTAQSRLVPGPVPGRHHQINRRPPRRRRRPDLGAVEPRRPPPRVPPRSARRRRPRGLAAQQRHRAARSTPPGRAPGPRRDPDDAGPARIGLPLPRRGTWAYSRWPTCRPTPYKTRSGTHRPHPEGPRRRPRPPAMEQIRQLVRLQRRRLLATPTALVRRILRASPN